MTRQNNSGAFLLIGGVALLAMTAGHSLVRALGSSAGYRHVVQGPAAELGVIFVVAALIGIAAHIVRSLRDTAPGSDWALPSLATIQTLGPVRVVTAVVAVQTLALFAGESLEQHLAGVGIGGLAGLYGSTLLVAPLIHLAVGVSAAILLWFAARAVRTHASIAVAIARAALAWLTRDVAPVVAKRDRFAPFVVGPQRRPVANKLANRPPPASVRLA